MKNNNEMNDCIFCNIVNGKFDSAKIWEDEEYLAILDIMPNTKGMALVMTKKHYESYAFDMPDKETLKAIAEASQANLVIAVEASNLGTCFVPYHTGRSPWFLSCLIRSYDSSTKKYLTRYFNHTDTFGSGERGGDINGAITKIATQTFELALQK